MGPAVPEAPLGMLPVGVFGPLVPLHVRGVNATGTIQAQDIPQPLLADRRVEVMR
jgi:hypothetical protein